jgi:hypothetical protein
MTNDEVRYFIDALTEITNNIHKWEKDYVYLNRRNEFLHKDDLENKKEESLVKTWFKL